MFRDFLWKSDPLECHISVYLNMWVSPHVSPLHIIDVTCHFTEFIFNSQAEEHGMVF